MLKYFLLWFPMVIIAVINGTIREWYKTYTGEPIARQISTITLIIFFAFYIYWAINKLPIKTDMQAFQIGLLWGVLTLAFEFGFGLYAVIPLVSFLRNTIYLRASYGYWYPSGFLSHLIY